MLAKAYISFLVVLFAHGASAMPPSSLKPFTAATVRDYLSACKMHHDTCALEVGSALVDKLDYKGVAQVCLASGFDPNAVIAWLGSHQEVQQLPRQDGIYLALKSLYACK